MEEFNLITAPLDADICPSTTADLDLCLDSLDNFTPEIFDTELHIHGMKEFEQHLMTPVSTTPPLTLCDTRMDVETISPKGSKLERSLCSWPSETTIELDEGELPNDLTFNVIPPQQQGPKKAPRWRKEEDKLLTKYVDEFGKKWKQVSVFIPGRSASQCCNRWNRIKPEASEPPQKPESVKPTSPTSTVVAECKPEPLEGVESIAIKAEPKPAVSRKRKAEPDVSTALWFRALQPSNKKNSDRQARWKFEEDQMLKNAVKQHKGKSWKTIAAHVPGRTSVQCLQRWEKVLRPGLVKGSWTQDEDSILKRLMESEEFLSSTGVPKWSEISKHIAGRTPKQCRERWNLSLDPSINRAPWTEEEDRQLLALVQKHGNRWTTIRASFDGRTENAVKGRFNSLMRSVRKDKAVVWTESLKKRMFELCQEYNNDLTRIQKRLPRALRGISPSLIRCFFAPTCTPNSCKQEKPL